MFKVQFQKHDFLRFSCRCLCLNNQFFWKLSGFFLLPWKNHDTVGRTTIQFIFIPPFCQEAESCIHDPFPPAYPHNSPVKQMRLKDSGWLCSLMGDLSFGHHVPSLILQPLHRLSRNPQPESFNHIFFQNKGQGGRHESSGGACGQEKEGRVKVGSNN